MSISAQHKANERERKAQGKPSRTFAQYKADQERMAAARAARGTTKAVKRASKPQNTAQAQIDALLAQIEALKAAQEPVAEVKPARARKAKVQVQDEVERIGHRVDCFGVNRAGIVTLAVDKADVRKAEKALGSLYCLRGESYVSSGRGERTRLQIQQAQVQKAVKALVSAGLTPAGARGWKRASVTL